MASFRLVFVNNMHVLHVMHDCGLKADKDSGFEPSVLHKFSFKTYVDLHQTFVGIPPYEGRGDVAAPLRRARRWQTRCSDVAAAGCCLPPCDMAGWGEFDQNLEK